MRVLQETTVAGERKKANKLKTIKALNCTQKNKSAKCTQLNSKRLYLSQEVDTRLSFLLTIVFFLCLQCSYFHSFALNPDFLPDLVMTCPESWIVHYVSQKKIRVNFLSTIKNVLLPDEEKNCVKSSFSVGGQQEKSAIRAW